jgi:hypothetical protein
MQSIFMLLMLFAPGIGSTGAEVFLPIDAPDRHSLESLALTRIGGYGIMRAARPTVPSHFHTGIDIRRPHPNYTDEPIFPAARGVVISRRTDGPYAQLIIEHDIGGIKFWTVYEHIAGLTVKDSSLVDPHSPIARFFSKEELQKYGWQFDHFHFEVLKVHPFALGHDGRHPDRYYSSYTLECHTVAGLNRYFYDPLEFFALSWSRTIPRMQPSGLAVPPENGRAVTPRLNMLYSLYEHPAIHYIGGGRSPFLSDDFVSQYH